MSSDVSPRSTCSLATLISESIRNDDTPSKSVVIGEADSVAMEIADRLLRSLSQSLIDSFVGIISMEGKERGKKESGIGKKSLSRDDIHREL